MREIGNSYDVTQIEPSPAAISPPLPGTPTSIVAVTLLVFGSIRDTLPSPWQSTQTEPSPVVKNRGFALTSIRAITKLVSGSTRSNLFSSVQVTHSAPSPNATVKHPAGNRTSATILLVAGSRRASVLFASVSSHRLSALTARPPSESATPVGIVAVIFAVLRSTRASA